MYGYYKWKFHVNHFWELKGQMLRFIEACYVFMISSLLLFNGEL